MLTNGPRHGYWCECWTQDLTEEERPTLRASLDAYSASQADRWVAVTLRTISPALDSDASDTAWAWLSQGRIATRQALLRSEPCTVTITHAQTRRVEGAPFPTAGPLGRELGRVAVKEVGG
ncbi:hypothetical protein QF037_005151 [Streptomyces canus]|nr:hypothetical protein [Streptomyces canus]